MTRVLLTGGRIVTPGGPAEAMLTDGGTITWVGRAAEAPGLDQGAARVVDLDGALVTPGFVDAHVHLSQTGQTARSLSLGSTLSRAQALVEIEAHCERSSGDVALGDGWDESTWPERTALTRTELDPVSHGRLVYLGRVDGHSAVINTALAERVPGLASAEGWHVTGLVEREAHHLVRDAVAELMPRSDRKADIRYALRQAASVGITQVHEAAAPHIAPFDDLELIIEVRAEDDLPEVVPYWGDACGAAGLDDADLVRLGIRGYAGDFNVDGSIGSRTAGLHANYADAGHAGHLYLEASAIGDHLTACTRRGLQAGFHVIGDRAMSTVTDGLREAARQCGADAVRAARHRLEHAELASPDDLEVLAELGVVVSGQPAFDAAWGGVGRLYEQRLGADRAARMNAWRSYADAGVVLAFGSDSPVTPLDPWAGVYAAAHHTVEGQGLTLSEAFDAHTRGGHRAAGNDRGGWLAPGLAASYALWEWSGPCDEAGLPVLGPDERPVCLRTVVEGRVAFDALG